MDPNLLKILRCPETRQRLSPAPLEKVQAINVLIRNGSCRNRAGQQVSEILNEALIREDETTLYPVRNGIAILLPDEGLDCEKN